MARLARVRRWGCGRGVAAGAVGLALELTGASVARAEEPRGSGAAELSAELSLGAHDRWGMDQTSPGRAESGGVVGRLQLWYGPSASWALGLGAEHAGLGAETVSFDAGSYRARSSLTSAWLDLRASLWRGPELGAFVSLGLALGWQHVLASGVAVTDARVHRFSCSATDGPALGLGAGVGADYRVAPRLSLVALGDFSAHRTSGDVLEGCVGGAGSVVALGARLGLAYHFEL